MAGVGDRVPGRPMRSRAIRWMKKKSRADIAERITWDDVPGTDAKSCGNYRDHSLHSAREWCRLVLAQGISLDPFDRSVLA